LSNKFKTNEIDTFIYVKNTDKSYTIIYLHVNDILIIGSNDHMIKSIKIILTKKSDMKDLGVANVILGIKLSKIFDGSILSHSHYFEKIFDKFSKCDNCIVKKLRLGNRPIRIFLDN
jgi:hypothetical protein